MNADTWLELLTLAQRDDTTSLSARIAALAPELAQQAPIAELHEPYGRALLARTELGEVMLAGWNRGGRSAPHDHGLARGYVSVLSGPFRETSYRFEHGELSLQAQRPLAPGDLFFAAAGAIHDMHALEHGVTLHLYLPAIHHMYVYDPAARSTLLVVGDCGAWVPRRAELILERRPWSFGSSHPEV